MSDATSPLSGEELRLIRNIMHGFKAAEWRALKTLARAMVTANGAEPSTGGSGAAVASDAELDGQYGTPTVRRDPKRWAGASYVGARYSECPSDYLIVLAEGLEYFAEKDRQKPEPKRHKNGTPFWEYDLKDAARARGWAARNRGKEFSPPSRPDTSDADEGTAVSHAAEEEWVP